ncbi:WD40/YVTN/BNR-like repeat-containing protein [Lutibacter flavus]|uniref:Photosynthesis system II assembly factor Ycf48/Hcf136-like domain-containing protein n=1 Tax=Lutibacter flavus TaxID=691689 RepID=A0A238ZLA8_9FLAO|nr:hypothetical protein [Lutibacter flavus]SNR83484.1 hypothetical protein SAMN04488111_3364 [Lutibacter flavus]
MKKIIVISLILTLFSCSKEVENMPDNPQDEIISFESLGLEGKIVHQIIATDSILIAATDQGVYKSDFSSNWTLMGLQKKNVIAISIIDSNTIVCSVTDDDQFQNPQLLKSLDFGQSWSVVESNFGGETPEIIFELRYNSSSNELLASGKGVIASSFDEGKTWVIQFGFWNAFTKGLWALEINPANNQVWAGGQNAIESQVIVQLDSDREEINQWINVLPSPSTVEKFAFNNDSNRIILGCEDGILLTEDNGNSWKNIYSNDTVSARFYYGLVYDNLDSEKIIAASWDKNFERPQPLMLHISEDNGETWSIITPNIPLIFGGTRDMLQRQENGKTVLYLGLWKGGVYRAEIQ